MATTPTKKLLCHRALATKTGPHLLSSTSLPQACLQLYASACSTSRDLRKVAQITYTRQSCAGPAQQNELPMNHPRSRLGKPSC